MSREYICTGSCRKTTGLTQRVKPKMNNPAIDFFEACLPRRRRTSGLTLKLFQQPRCRYYPAAIEAQHMYGDRGTGRSALSRVLSLLVCASLLFSAGFVDFFHTCSSDALHTDVGHHSHEALKASCRADHEGSGRSEDRARHGTSHASRDCLSCVFKNTTQAAPFSVDTVSSIALPLRRALDMPLARSPRARTLPVQGIRGPPSSHS